MMIIWCMVHEILSTTDRTFCHLELFFALLSPNNPENQNFEKMKKTPGGIIIFKHEYHTWKSCDVWFLRYGSRQTEFFLILNHLLPFYKIAWRFHNFTQVYHKWLSYDIWFLRYEVQQTECFCHLGPFFDLLPLSSKNENSKKMKKTSGDIILHKYTKNHMLYCSWDMVCDGCNCYFSFWAIFCPFTPLTAQKMKILK